jgi:hypothetical protein
MYSITLLDGILAIQRNGQTVLSVWDKDWEFAHEICNSLNRRQDDPEISLTVPDRNWLKAMDRVFSGELQPAASREEHALA